MVEMCCSFAFQQINVAVKVEWIKQNEWHLIYFKALPENDCSEKPLNMERRNQKDLAHMKIASMCKFTWQLEVKQWSGSELIQQQRQPACYRQTSGVAQMHRCPEATFLGSSFPFFFLLLLAWREKQNLSILPYQYQA